MYSKINNNIIIEDFSILKRLKPTDYVLLNLD